MREKLGSVCRNADSVDSGRHFSQSEAHVLRVAAMAIQIMGK